MAMRADQDTTSQRIADYVRGRLEDDEVRRFELEMLEDDELFARVQREDLLRRGLQTANLDAREGRGFFPAWLRPALTGALALAVAVLGVHAWRLDQRLEQLQAPATGVPVVTLLQQRALLPGDGGLPESPIEGPALLEIDVSMHGMEAFDLELKLVREARFLRRVRPDSRGYVTVLVPPGQILHGVDLLDTSGAVLRRHRFD